MEVKKSRYCHRIWVSLMRIKCRRRGGDTSQNMDKRDIVSLCQAKGIAVGVVCYEGNRGGGGYAHIHAVHTTYTISSPIYTISIICTIHYAPYTIHHMCTYMASLFCCLLSGDVTELAYW
jgi:hypothetical protein